VKLLPLFAPKGTLLTKDVGPLLERAHYLGPHIRGIAYHDELGVMAFCNPASRHLPRTWFELARWCIDSEAGNAGSRQWGRAARWLHSVAPDVTTVVSYSDPAVGHLGALYRACNWLWAPTWHRLEPPPTGNGSWGIDGVIHSVKDRWVFPLRRDPARQAVLAISDAGVRARWPWAEYREPSWKRNRWHGGGGDFRRFVKQLPLRGPDSDPEEGA
jgi:hypothetical protein